MEPSLLVPNYRQSSEIFSQASKAVTCKGKEIFCSQCSSSRMRLLSISNIFFYFPLCCISDLYKNELTTDYTAGSHMNGSASIYRMQHYLQCKKSGILRIAYSLSLQCHYYVCWLLCKNHTPFTSCRITKH